MLLKRKEKDNVIKAMYASSNILASTYNKETSDLILIFNKGGQYKYPNVKTTDYTRFELAESQGHVFNTHIKQYTFERLEDVNPSAIITEIENMKVAEQKALLEGMQLKIVEKMNQLILMDSLITESGKTLFTEFELQQLISVSLNYILELNKNTVAING